LDPIASAQSLVRAMIGLAVDQPESNTRMLAVSGGRAEAMTAEQVARLAAEGDPVARGVVDRALDALAPALANLVATLDPDAIVVGGPLAGVRAFLDPLEDRVAALCQPFTTAPPLLGGELEPVAALSGAVAAAAELAGGMRAEVRD
jgi:glucokinase